MVGWATVGWIALVWLLLAPLGSLPNGAIAEGIDCAQSSRCERAESATSMATEVLQREGVGERIGSGTSVGGTSVAIEVTESESDGAALPAALLERVRWHGATRLQPRSDEEQGQCCLRTLLTRAPPATVLHGCASTSALAVRRPDCA